MTKSTMKKARKPALPPAHDWRTTDADEINKRRQRAREETFVTTNASPAHPIFSNFRVQSASGLTYSVEVRNLAARQFACDCVDFRINGLGVCKHVEAVLLQLEARHRQRFKDARASGSDRIEVLLDHSADTLRVLNGHDSLPRAVARWFDADGRLVDGSLDAVDGFEGETGDIALRIYPAPPGAANDAFTNRSALFGLSATDSVSTESASREAGEPVHAGYQGGKSVWWSWKAPASGLCQLDTVGSSFDTLLAVYTGTSLDALTLIAENDGDDSDGFIISRLQFQAVEGTTYQIAVDGYLGAAGDAVINLSLQAAVAAGGNDNFSNRILLTGATNSATGVNTNASKEVGEPNHHGNIGGKSIWWKWVAPATALVTINTRGSDFDAVLGVYTGSTVASLTTIASDHHGADDASTVTFEAIAGTEYQIAVDGFRAGTDQGHGRVVLNLRQYTAGPQIANDNFEDATPITAFSPIVTGSNLGATRQVGEPIYSGVPDGRSAWWTYTALENGPVTVSTDGSELDTVLSVYVGSTISSLTLVAENDDPRVDEFHAQVTFQATAGTVYRIAVAGYRGAMGLVKLSVISGSTSPIAPSIQQQPDSQTRFASGAGGGSVVEFRVVATGAPPLAYQWTRNGLPIANANGPVLALTGVSIADAGVYEVLVTNSLGVAVSQPAVFTQLANTFNDHFTNRILLTGNSETVSGSVLAATKEPGEPSHGGNDGGRSVWWKWIAPANGLVELDTVGSSFDTTLAIYTGNVLASLTPIIENDDLRVGQVGASRVLFMAAAGTEYQIAVDGFKTNSTTGNVVLNLRQPPAPPLLVTDLPNEISLHHTNTLTLQPGVAGLAPLFKYQWFFNGAPLVSATNSTLPFGPLSRASSGNYALVITNDFGSVTTRTASVWVQVPQQLLAPQRLPDGRVQLYFSDPDGTLSSNPSRFEIHHTLRACLKKQLCRFVRTCGRRSRKCA